MPDRANERTAAFEAFRHVVSHDLRSPLGAIANLAAVLEGGAEGMAPKLGADIRRIVASTDEILTAGSAFARALLEPPGAPARLAELAGALCRGLAPPADLRVRPGAAAELLVEREPTTYLLRAYLEAARAAGAGPLQLDARNGPAPILRVGPQPEDLDRDPTSERWERLIRHWARGPLTAMRLGASWLEQLGGRLRLASDRERFPALELVLPPGDS